MVKAGIIDPVKVIRTALVDAARYYSLDSSPLMHPVRVGEAWTPIVSLFSL